MVNALDGLPLGAVLREKEVTGVAFHDNGEGFVVHPLGAKLRDDALASHSVNHKADIEKVRVALLVACRMGGFDTFTADDVFVIAERMDLTSGDTRWLGAVTRGWKQVRNTGRYQPSRLKQRNARPIPVWAVETP